MYVPQNADQRGISPIVATVFLILATVIAGGALFYLSRTQVTAFSSNADLKVQSMDLVTASGGSQFSIAVKNTGSVPLDDVGVSLLGVSQSYSTSDFSRGTHENTESGSLKLIRGYPTLAVFDNPSDGSEDSGIPIDNVDELQAVQNDLNQDYYLTQDIDASETVNWNGGKGFKPIRGEFTGTFDGNGHVIENLYINRPSTDYVALFGHTGSGALIENVGLVNENINGQNCVSGLVQWNWGKVSNCYSTGSVSGDNKVGSLVESNDGSVSNCYSISDISGDIYVNGLVQYNNGSVSNCYFAGSVSGNIASGLVYNLGSCSDSFWDVETSGQSSSTGGAGKATENMQKVRTFTDTSWSDGLSSPWDFTGDPFDDSNGSDLWKIRRPSSGKWTSQWIDLGGAINFSSLASKVTIPGEAGAGVRVQVSDDAGTVKNETPLASLEDGLNTIFLESLSAAKYVRVIYELTSSSTPVVKNYKLSYTPGLVLGPIEPGATASDSVNLLEGISSGKKSVVKITAYDSGGNSVLEKTVTLTARS